MERGLALEYGQRQTEAATKGAILVLKKVAMGQRDICGAQASCALVLHVWGCRVALQRVLAAMKARDNDPWQSGLGLGLGLGSLSP